MADFYQSPGLGRSSPKIQLLTLDSPVHRAEGQMPTEHGVFPQARRVQETAAEQLEFAVE